MGGIIGAQLETFALGGSGEIYAAKGAFEGQSVDWFPKSKSMLEAAYEMDDCPTEARINRDKLVKRDIKDKKKAAAKQRILTSFVNKLDRNRGGDRYSEYERKLMRLKQQVMLQNQNSGRGGSSSKALTYDGENLADRILRDIPLDFDEVTEQDNALEYLQEAEDFEADSNKEEIAQCKKMLARLEGRHDAKSQERISELMAKIRDLEEQIYFSSSFKQALSSAQKKLRDVHEKEIEDGYNIIPKVVDLMKNPLKIGGKQLTAVDLAAIYRDKILCCSNFLEAFAALVSICMSGGHSGPIEND
jgi:hypothetical protein